jgi:VanZ family protein
LSLSLALLATAVVVGLSMLPGSAVIIRVVPKRVQKAMHVVAYAILAALWSGTFLFLGLEPLRRCALAAGLAGSMGALLEYIQRYRPGRYSSWSDVARNALGAVVGAAITWWI